MDLKNTFKSRVIWPRIAKVPVVCWWRSELSYIKLPVVFLYWLIKYADMIILLMPGSPCCQVDLFGLIHFKHPEPLMCISWVLKQSIVVKVCNIANGFIFFDSKCNLLVVDALQFTNKAVCTNYAHEYKNERPLSDCSFWCTVHSVGWHLFGTFK